MEGNLGVSISYFEEKEPLGTGGALFQMPDILQDDFFLLNGDIMLDIDFKRMENITGKKEDGSLFLRTPMTILAIAL